MDAAARFETGSASECNRFETEWVHGAQSQGMRCATDVRSVVGAALS